MALQWYKISYLLIVPFCITACYGADREAMLVESEKKRSRSVEADYEPFRQAKRQKLDDDKELRKREGQIEKICNGLISPFQIKQIDFNELFPSQDFPTFTVSELNAYLMLWPKKDPINQGYVTEVSQRVKLGHCDAQNTLGLMYLNGKGMPQDNAMATHWFEKAAKQGYIPALNNLGDSYYYGHGILQDYKIAVVLFKRAAKQGYAPAQTNLGDMYYLGRGVEQNYMKALELYEKAALQGYVEAYNGLGDVYYLGKGVRDYAKAFHWHRKAAKLNYIPSQKRLGNMYNNGHGITKDSVQAFQWYERAALQEDPQAQYNLGCMYDAGQGVPKNVAQAILWYAKSAVQGEKSSQENLLTFFVGVGGRESVKELTKDITEHRDALADSLAHLKDHYYFYAGFSGGKFKDNFGENHSLLFLSNLIIHQIEKYQLFLDDHIFKPGYFVDCLSIKPELEKTKEFKITLPVQSNHDISKEFVSMFSLETLMEISTGQLAAAVTKLTEMVGGSYLLLKEIGQMPDQLRGALMGLKYADKEFATLFTGFTQRFLAASEEKAANEEYMHILEHFESMYKTLQEHTAFTTQLNDQIYRLIIQTIPYRNHLTKQNYPFLFN